MTGERKKICVVGAGVIGLTTAVRVIEQLNNVDVTIIAKDFSPNTTGDISGGFWLPFMCGDVDKNLLEKWCTESFDFFLELTRRPCAKDNGVGLLSCLSDYTGEFLGDKQILGLREMSEKEKQVFPMFKKAAFFTTIYAQCSKFLPYLQRRFEAKGGKVKIDKIASFAQLANDYDVVVNCTGLGAYTLVPDPTLCPIRGQIVRVRAPWIKHAVNCGRFHALPNSDYVQLGGTTQKGNWSTIVDPKDTEEILKGCYELIPSLQRADIIEVNVGLRPGREAGPRVQIDAVANSKRNIPLIHNYGHGGSGVTLSWGCAGTVVELIQIALNQTGSKL